MKTWLAELNPRERIMVLIAAAALALFLFYMLIWQPITSSAENMTTYVVQQQSDLQWMQRAVEDVKRQRPAASAQGQIAPGQSLLSLIDQTSKGANLGGAVKRVRPEGENKVSVWMEDASFDDMVRWLEGLQRGFGIAVDSVVIDRKNVPGKVDARIEITGVTHG